MRNGPVNTASLWIGVTAMVVCSGIAWAEETPFDDAILAARQRLKNVEETAQSASPQRHGKRALPATRPSVVRGGQETAPVPTSPEEEETRLSKNWGGSRKRLSDRGIDVGLVYKGELNSNLRGGRETSTVFLGNIDFRVAFDGEKLAGAKGTSAFLYLLADHGGDPSKSIGDSQVTSNIETNADTVKIYEAWVQQLLFADKVSVLVGLHDLNSEFYVTESSGLFFNSTFGIGKELSQTGQNGPSIFPTTSPALRLRAEPAQSFYFQFAGFNSVAGNPDNPKGTHIRLRNNDGLFLIAEAAYLRGREAADQLPGKYAIGTWTYTATFDHLTETISSTDANGDTSTTPVKATSHGTYFLAEQAVTDRIVGFGRFGLASTEVNQFRSCLSGGLVFTGLLPFRPKDRFGISFTRAENGREFREQQEALGINTDEAEATLEANYRIELLPGVVLQPDLQYVMNPGTDPNISNAFVFATRIELNF